MKYNKQNKTFVYGGVLLVYQTAGSGAQKGAALQKERRSENGLQRSGVEGGGGGGGW